MVDFDPHQHEDVSRPKAPVLPGLRHYYGDVTRRLFLAGGILMIVFSPIYPDLLPSVSTMFVLLGAVLLSVFAGVTNPAQFGVNVIDVVLAASSFLIFETAAFQGYTDWFSVLFLVRQGIAVIFFFSLYFSAKTLRGMLVR